MASLRRPLAVVGFSMLITVLCIILTGCTALAVFAVVLAGVGTVLSFILLFRTADTVFAACIGIAIGALLLLNAQYAHDKAQSFCGEDRYIKAVVYSEAEESRDNGRIYVVASLKSVYGEKAGGKIRLSFPSTDATTLKKLRIGDKITFSANVYRIGADSQSVHDSFTSRKIYLGAHTVELNEVVQPGIRPLRHYAAFLRNKIRDTFSDNFSQEVSGLLTALLTGDKSDCPYPVYMNFKKSGAAHVMAVSGLHLTILVSAFLCLWKRLEKLRKLSIALSLPLVLFIVYLADFSPSVCRAALMISLYLIGSLINEKSDSLNSIGFSLICILCVNPFAVNAVSFQLSFACVLAITLVAVPLCTALEDKLKKRIRNKLICRATLYAASSIIISITISVATYPISSHHFGYVSLVSPLTNLFILPVCTILMISSVLFLIFNAVPFVSEIFHFTSDVFAKYMLLVTENFSSLTFSTLCTDMREKLLWFVAAFVIAILFLLKHTNRKRMLGYASVFTVILTIFSILVIADKRADECRLKVINTDAGSAVVLIYNGRGVLLGSADDYYFSSMLSEVVEAENIDLIAAVPINESDIKDMEYICNDFEIENMLADGEGVELFGFVRIEAEEYGAEINVNGKRAGVFSQDYLQVDEYYDIIIRNDGTMSLSDGRDVSCGKKGHSMTVYLNSRSNISVRREELWLNLTKKS